MPDYRVREGDCISSIAFTHGFFAETLWEHPNNAELKQIRKNMNHLEPGDIVHIPEKEIKLESGASEQTHRFRKKGVPAKLKLRILKQSPLEEQSQTTQSTTEIAAREDAQYDEPSEVTGFEEEPWTDCSYHLIIDGATITGKTDGDGFLETTIPPNAQKGKLIMDPEGPAQKIIQLRLGSLGSFDETAGIKRRLSNLGYNCNDRQNEMTPDFVQVLKLFQESYDLKISGELDDATKNKIKELTEQ